AFPDDFPVDLPDREVFGNGGAAIVEPTWGELIAGPAYGEETILYADCNLRRGLDAKRWFDVTGHYGRTDVLTVDPTTPASGWPRLAAPGATHRSGPCLQHCAGPACGPRHPRYTAIRTRWPRDRPSQP